ncbi:c-type cytochrome [Patulibacter minatonensis]|uniref:c-type cytochrome n=1 Tax=Patulibacter minatonensis TaxID=298163 RepID=UPI00047E334B|nr:cytochrome c [Patulibacter minatonensis]
MSPTWIRWMLAAIVVVVLGGTIIGIGEGGGDGGGGGARATTTAPPGSGKALATLGPVADQGRKVFGDNGCGGCHRLADAKSGGTIGPDLDQALSASDLAEIREDIVDPGAQGTPGFPSGRMPDGYDRLSTSDLDALVRYLQAATSGK